MAEDSRRHAGDSLTKLERNLGLLSLRQPQLAQILRASNAERVRTTRSRTGSLTASYLRSASDVISLHSKYDPIREATVALKSLDLREADYFILLGFGLGYGIDALLEKVSDSNNNFFIIESEIQILRAAFESRDLGRVLSLPSIHFAWPTSGSELAEQWQEFFDPVQAKKSIFVPHAPSLVLHPHAYHSATETIQSQTFQVFTDINTLVGKVEVFMDNFVKNLPVAVSSPGVSKFAGRFSKTPAIVVAAGPSLDRNIHELRHTEDRALILATDTALKPLLAAGIEPHFVVAADSSYENYLHLEGARTKQTILVAEATAYPGTFKCFDERTITCIFDSSALRGLSDLLGPKGRLRAWGSVSTMALDFGLLLGCDPIVFVGQDLAYSGGHTYCCGVYFENTWLEEVQDPEAGRIRLASWRARGKIVPFHDIFGQIVESTDKLTAYWNWISKEIRNHPHKRFINATEGGILAENVEIMSLRETLYRYCLEKRSLCEQVGSLYARERQIAAADRLDKNILDRLSHETGQVEQTLQRGLDLCSCRTSTDPRTCLSQLETCKESIYSAHSLAPLIDCLNQMGNVTFLRRRAGVARIPHDRSLLSAIHSVYRDYFESVEVAVKKVNEVLRALKRSEIDQEVVH